MTPMVVVPWRPGCRFRERNLGWVRGRWEALGWPVVVAEGSDPWVKALAVNPAAARADTDLVVVADADCWTDGIHEAVERVERGAGWAMPHDKVRRLSNKGTEGLIAGLADLEVEELHTAYRGGGIVVAPKSTLVRVPLDPRFVGWGGEDRSWALALDTLAGIGWRGDGILTHLWHPPQERVSRRRGSAESERLHRRYFRARRRPKLMRALLDEIGVDGVSPHADQPRMHADAA